MSATTPGGLAPESRGQVGLRLRPASGHSALLLSEWSPVEGVLTTHSRGKAFAV